MQSESSYLYYIKDSDWDGRGPVKSINVSIFLQSDQYIETKKDCCVLTNFVDLLEDKSIIITESDL